MKCNFCDFENKDNKVYCEKCGMNLGIKKRDDIHEILHDNSDNNSYTNTHLYGLIAIGVSAGTVGFPFIGQMAGIILGIISLIKGLINLNKNKKKSLIGIILGLLAIIIAVLVVIHWIYRFDYYSGPVIDDDYFYQI